MRTDRDQIGDKRADDERADDERADDERAAARLGTLADGLGDTLRTAEALVRARRRVDLAGLEAQTQNLCAGVLGLPAEAARPLRERLGRLLGRIDSLLAALAGA